MGIKKTLTSMSAEYCTEVLGYRMCGTPKTNRILYVNCIGSKIINLKKITNDDLFKKYSSLFFMY